MAFYSKNQPYNFFTISSSVSNHIKTGKTGEDIAYSFLAANGHIILERNWRYRHLEIDIISETTDFIVFTEVKTRNIKNITEPWRAVNKKKQLLLIRAANVYILRKKTTKEVRFDIISIIIHPSGEPELEYIQDAFTALK